MATAMQEEKNQGNLFARNLLVEFYKHVHYPCTLFSYIK